jgi:Cytidylate kinase-like family
MVAQLTTPDKSDLQAAQNVLKAAIYDWNNPFGAYSKSVIPAFVTVSRQPYAGGISFSHHLAARLNEMESGNQWSAWDHELIEKVSASEGIEEHIIEMITQRPHTWLDDLLEGFSNTPEATRTSEFRVYKRVAMAIRALAAAGHAIIVGQGGVFVTSRMQAGIHLRLVAPLEFRMKSMADQLHLPLYEAAERIEEAEHNRETFLKRYWPGKSIGPESFTMTLNAGEMSVEDMVECVVPIILRREFSQTGHQTPHPDRNAFVAA